MMMAAVVGKRSIWMAALFGLVGSVATSAQAATDEIRPRPVLAAAIDEGQRVELKGNVRPEATKPNDRGAVADNLPMNHMQLLLQRSAEQEHALGVQIDALHDPKSPDFHHWLTADQFGRQYGLAQQDIDRITTWLTAHRLRVNVIYPNALVIDFSGSAGAVREAFHTQIHRFAAHGALHVANASNPQIPAALAPAVKGVVSLHDFRPRSMLKRKPKYTSGSSRDMTPADLATIYNFNPVFAKGVSGQGQTIALIEDTDIYSAQDWVAFRNAFGLSGYTTGKLVQLHPAPKSGTNNCADPGVNTADIEAILDAEWASAGAPSATIELVSCADVSASTYTFGGLIAMQNLLNANTAPPPIISISYGECEAYNGATANAAYVSAYQQAVAEGVSVFVSAGDEGAASCDAGQNAAYSGISVSGFASTPYNVAVGGTDFGDTYAGASGNYWNTSNSSTYGSVKSYVPEIPWNDSCGGSLFTQYSQFQVAYGANGVCNSPVTTRYPFDTTVAGSGGPSNCAAGAPVFDSNFTITAPGSCQGTTKPSWQTGVLGLPNDGVRDIPDVSLFASNGFWNHAYIVCYSDLANSGAACTGAPSGWTGLGGTSVSTPIMAGIQALINQSTGSTWGNPNYVYYKLAASEYGSAGNAGCNSSNGGTVGSNCIFYDITQGDNVVNCIGKDCYGFTTSLFGVLSTSTTNLSPAYPSQTGWDFATGIGTVNVANLIANWNNP